MCNEMIKLREWLDDHNIKWWDKSTTYDDYFYMHRTGFIHKGREFSVINGVGSYGGCVCAGYKNQGLLEMWVDQKGEPRGCLTAEDVIKEILK